MHRQSNMKGQAGCARGRGTGVLLNLLLIRAAGRFQKMAAIKLLTFSQALDKAANYSKRHLLLGNGFSIACEPTIFTYGSLFERAKPKCHLNCFGSLNSFIRLTLKK